MDRLFRFYCGLIVAVLSLSDFAFSIEKPNVEVALYGDHEAVTAGGSFSVGVKFTIPTPWHIYWKHPGDSGLPTRLKFRSEPEGLVFGDVQWPLPEQFEQPGGLHGIGYSGSVVLLANVDVPKSFDHEKAKVIVDAKWLNCSRTLCVRGKGAVSSSVSIGGQSYSSHYGTLRAWESKLPTIYGPNSPFALADKGDLIELEWSTDVRSVQMFPVLPKGVKLLSDAVSHDGMYTKITYSLDKNEPFESLIVYETSNRVKRGVTVTLGTPTSN